MRIRDIEIDDDLAREIDVLLISMDEFAIQATRAYFKTGSIAEAVKLLIKIGVTSKAGKKVSEASVRSVLKQETSMALLGLLRRALSHHTIRDAIWAEHQFAKIYDRCMEPRAITNKDGFTGVFEFESVGANRALENIVKLRGLGENEKSLNKGSETLATLADILGRIGSSKPKEDR